MAVKIKLMRLGKIRAPHYRIVVADSRTKRDGRAIEEIGKYHPKQEPSLIEVDSERAQYWLSVGAQPTEPVAAILKITGDWQKFKGLPGAEGTLQVAEPKADKKAVFEAAAKDAAGEPKDGATTPKKRAAKKADAAEARRRGRCARRGRCDPPRPLPSRLLPTHPPRRPSPRSRRPRRRPPRPLREAEAPAAEAAAAEAPRTRPDRARGGPRAPGPRHRRAPGRRVGPATATPAAAAPSRSGCTPTTSAR